MACGDEGNYVHDLESTDFQGHSTTPAFMLDKEVTSRHAQGVS